MEWSLYLRQYSKTDFVHSPDTLLDFIDFYTPDKRIEAYQITILGVPEERNSENIGTSKSPFLIRQEFYKLYPHWEGLRVLDMGDVIKGNTIKDTYVAVKEIVAFLSSKGNTVIILGGSQDISFPLAEAVYSIKSDIVVSSIDSRLDFGNEQVLNSKSIWNFLQTKFENLKVQAIGIQQYLNNSNEIELWERKYNTILKLGKFRDNMLRSEPLLRDSDLISFDISSIRQSDSNNDFGTSPNGFYAEEACQLAWYAGLSDRANIFGLFETNSNDDRYNQTLKLSAQVLWHYIDGYYHRKNDYPVKQLSTYKIYYVPIKNQDFEILFYESQSSNRWWMQVDFSEEKFSIVSCLIDDYLEACNGIIPTIWHNEYNRNTF